MAIQTTARPERVGVTGKGEPAYNGPELGAYRATSGVSQEAMAAYLHVTRLAITMTERRKTVGERSAIRYIKAVEYLMKKHQRMVDEGTAKLAAIRLERTTTTTEES